MTIHEAIHRLVLRTRFVRWVNRSFVRYRTLGGLPRLMRRSARLDAHRPIVRIRLPINRPVDIGGHSG